jgi:Asp-tRNA(Asn)/Glu-tRNA(Gln) amidotransferase A subunit family amidase
MEKAAVRPLLFFCPRGITLSSPTKKVGGEAMTYDLRPMKVPRLSGWRLKLVVRLVESRTFGPFVHKQMLQNLGFEQLRQKTTGAEIAHGPILPQELSKSSGPHPADGFDWDQRSEPSSGFSFESSADFRNAYLNQSSSPSDVVETLLKNLKASKEAKPNMGIFVSQNEDDLRQQAEASSERYRQGKSLGPLDGVPIPVKDELDQLPYPTMVGTSFMGLNQPAREDATIVSRMRAQGALMVGKVNMHELGIGVTGLNAHHGAVRNPYDTDCFTGGSSSGSAASVAAGFGPIALGADGGGSIRIPAALCGVVGLKATFGRISEHGAAPLCWSVAHVGPLAATVQDCALAYSFIAGPDPADPNTQNRPSVQLDNWQNRDLTGIRVGVFWPWFEDADSEIVEACKRALGNLENAGATIQEITIPNLDLLRLAHLVTIGIEMATSQIPHQNSHGKDYGLDTRLNLALGRGLKSTDYVHAQRHRTDLCRQFKQILEGVDVIATPATGCVAQKIPADALPDGESNLEQLSQIMRFAAPGNLTGLPAISLPVGYASSGLPMGFQMMGRPFEENLLLRLANHLEANLSRSTPQWYRSLL